MNIENGEERKDVRVTREETEDIKEKIL